MAAADPAIVTVYDESNFVSRKDILAWLNGFLELEYTRVEETASAAAHCQLLDALYPGQVPMHTVNFEAKFEHEFMHNFKIVQRVLADNGVQKHVEVQRLVKARYLDNFEFLRWMKAFFERQWDYQQSVYPAKARRDAARRARTALLPQSDSSRVASRQARASAQLRRRNLAASRDSDSEEPATPNNSSSSDDSSDALQQEQLGNVTEPASSSSPPPPAVRRPACAPPTRPRVKAATLVTPSVRRTAASVLATPARAQATPARAAAATPMRSTSRAAAAAPATPLSKPPAAATVRSPTMADTRIRELEDEVLRLRDAVRAITADRDFYFGLLRAVELRTQTCQSDVVSVSDLHAILYPSS